MKTPTVLLDGLAFSEGPRWHDEKLFFSDMQDAKVLTVDLDGRVETVAEVPALPSGLGWLPDGRLLVVSMEDRRLLRFDPDGPREVADLSSHATYHCNDMVVDSKGRAYIGNFGFDIHAEKIDFRKAEIVLVEPDGQVRTAASDLAFPNGTVITPDGRTLIVGESFGARLTAFDVAEDGSLSNRRVWAKLEKAVPDGICLDAEGAIWVASPISGAVLRVHEGGEVSERIPVTTQAIACMLGGPDRRTLFICTAEDTNPARCRANRKSRIETVRVDVPGAGFP
ncbi:MAG TPA: SMP-30/gluconolactonase/LRE family protein [Myxococcota bacterium]|nr:SMP-30/gluconolactonase/LRE family protein [Myxococcota bacterium]